MVAPSEQKNKQPFYKWSQRGQNNPPFPFSNSSSKSSKNLTSKDFQEQPTNKERAAKSKSSEEKQTQVRTLLTKNIRSLV